jgi:capsular exopolysaccharide synthesis family protein
MVTPRQYLDIIRTRWRFLVAGLLLGLVAAGAVTLFTPTRYESDVFIHLSAPTPPGDANAAVSGGELIRQRIPTYVDVLTSERLAGEVARQLGGGLTTSQVRESITATSSPETTLLTATATDTSPQRAADIANATAARFAATVVELESPSGAAGPALVSANVFQPAQPAVEPVSPRLSVNLALGGVLGLLIGAGLAILRQVTDTKVRTADQVRALLGVPVLGAVAADPAVHRMPLLVEADPAGRFAEAFRRLRTNLQFLDVDRNRRVWLVTSAGPGAGKTTTVANLALVLAEAGRRVLVVEADLRRPRVAEVLGVDRAIGLTNVLVRRMPGDQAIQRVRIGLDVLASGPLPPNPGEVLDSAAMAGLLAQTRDRYDAVLLDASPLAPVTDAVALARQVDGVLLVVPYGGVDGAQLQAAKETLETVGAPLLGAVLTKVATRHRRHDRTDDAYLAVRPEFDLPAGEQPVLAPAWTRTSDEPPQTNGFGVVPVQAGPRERPATPAAPTTPMPAASPVPTHVPTPSSERQAVPAPSPARVPSPTPNTSTPMPDGDRDHGQDGEGPAPPKP